MSILSLSAAPSINHMSPIGSVENLGATVLQGPVDAYASGTFGGPTDPVSAGYFGVTKGVFKMVYPFNEQAVVVHGSVKLTDVASGQSQTYKSGDSWFVTQGTEVLWEVESDFFIKHFFAVVTL